MTLADQSKTDRANAQFEKLQRVADGKKAMSEYEAELAATRAKTAKLRALRLARDAAAPAEPAPAAKQKPAKKSKAKAGLLSDWLDDQQKSGRNS